MMFKEHKRKDKRISTEENKEEQREIKYIVKILIEEELYYQSLELE